MRLIDADAFVAWIESVMTKEELSPAAAMVLSLVEGKLVIDTPKVDAAPVRHGRWVVERGETVMHCDLCGWAYEYYGGLEEEWSYCPHCGAKMDEEVKNGEED